MNTSNSYHLLNDQAEIIRTQGYNAAISVNNNSLKSLSLSYDARIGFIRNSLSGRSLDHISFRNHIVEFNILPKDNHILTLNSEYYKTNLKPQNDQVFIDLQYLLKIPKRKIDIEFSCLNLLNNKTYVRLYNSEFSIIENHFELRPRQFMLRTKFNF